jgi:predicted permease
MRHLTRLTSGLRALFGRARVEQDLDEELGAFLDASIEAKMAAGASETDARRAARLELGSAAAVKEWVGDAGWEHVFVTIAQDVRYAVRLMRRDRTFTLVAIGTLALGIGVNTAVFTLADGMLFRPLPYGDPDRLVILQTYDPKTGQVYGRVNGVDVEALAAHHSGVEALGLLEQGLSYTWIGGDGAESIASVSTSPNLLTVLRVGTFAGRPLVPGDERIDPRPAMLTYDAWQRRFGADGSVVGRTIAFQEGALQVVGILPPAFIVPPISGVGAITGLIVAEPTDPKEVGNPRAGTWAPIARLKPGVTIKAAQSETDILMARVSQQFPQLGANRAMRVSTLQYGLFERSHSLLFLLIGASAFVTVIAFTNLASLLLARGTARQQEIGIRAAIGASRGRLVRQLLVESQVLALAGSVAGLALGWWVFKLIAAQVPGGSYFYLVPEGLDGRALIFAVASALACGAIFGVLPAAKVSLPDVDGALRGRLKSAAPGARRAGALLVAAEVALGLILLCGASLMANSLLRARTVDLGFEPSHAVAMSALPPSSRYPQQAQRYQFWMTLLDDIRRIPGVTSAGAIDYLQLGGVAIPIALGPGAPRGSGLWSVTPGYFAAIQTPIVEGRDFTDSEGAGDGSVAIVNQSAAAFFWPNTHAVVGRVLRLEKFPPMEIVGVVKDVRYGYGRNAEPSVYRPVGPNQRMLTMVARAAGDPATVAASMRAAGQRLDPRLPIRMPMTVESRLQAGIANSRFQTTLFVLFGVLGCLLTAIGIYGVIAYWVSGRTQEMGIRLALGAQPSRLRRLVLREAMVPVAVGVAIGLAGALVLTRQLRSMLYEITPQDPATLVGATAFLLLVALAAAYRPARRASRIDPLIALKSE